MISRFFSEIKNAKIEREVEDVYNKGIEIYFTKGTNLQIQHPHACDGCLEKDLFLKLLIEYKYDEELQNEVSRAKVLVQVLYYLKRFEENGEKLPNVIMVGDINETFVIHSNCLLDYLDENVDWSIAPSNAHENNPELVMKIAKDGNINPFVFVVDNKFSFKDVADKIKDLAFNVQRHVRITEHNISKIFDYFTSIVISNSNKIAPNDLVGIFISSIIDKENCYKHPNNPNILVANGKHIQINGKIYDSFFSHFEKEYSPEEKNKFTEISDRLIEDTKRRRSGEFYTPTLFTDYAHKILSEQLGEDWKEKYVVWDCCWGTGNGLSIMTKNFANIVTIFSARRLIANNWINHTDQYLAPNEQHEKWQEFVNNSIIFSLFESKSQQSSLRNIDFDNQTWNIKNEFFFMSKNEIMQLANKNNFDFTYNDARVSEERFVYKKLQEIELSKEAQDVLDKAIELTKKSFKYREMFNHEHPEYQIMNWDCGWYQIKAVLKEYFKEDLEEFSKLYKILADKMRPMVYELGFLK